MFFLLWIKINYLTAMAKGIEAVVLPDVALTVMLTVTGAGGD
jgi:hypothetical protein